MKAAEATALLRGLTMADLRCVEMHSGVAWSATLLLEGVPVLRVEQGGNGGCNDYRPVGADYAAARATRDRLTEAAALLTGQRFEALDAVTSSLEPGRTGLDAVAAFRRAWGAA